MDNIRTLRGFIYRINLKPILDSLVPVWETITWTSTHYHVDPAVTQTERLRTTLDSISEYSNRFPLQHI
jgi:hypothetical protein